MVTSHQKHLLWQEPETGLTQDKECLTKEKSGKPESWDGNGIGGMRSSFWEWDQASAGIKHLRLTGQFGPGLFRILVMPATLIYHSTHPKETASF